MATARYKTAITRHDLSRPARLLLGSGIFDSSATFFDYGCGRGEDVALLTERGFQAEGWDPYYAPDNDKSEADFVAITYVLNVIEDRAERRVALREAWTLAERALIVSAQVTVDQNGKYQIPYSDGILTGSGTFQKYYTQSELKAYIEEVLGEEAQPVALGVFMVFRDKQLGNLFAAHRFRRRIAARRNQPSEEEQLGLRDSLEPLLEFYHERGRFIRKSELDADYSDHVQALGGMKRAERFVAALIGDDADRIREIREDDLLLFLAMARFQYKRHKLSSLPIHIQGDIKTFFGSLKKANQFAEFILFGLGEEGTIPSACRASDIGKLMPDALYVHADYVSSLPLVLRLVEALSSRYIGKVDGATLVKFSRRTPSVSYLFYPEFDEVGHPLLTKSIRVALGRLETEYTDYSERRNPPILHRKELFVASDYPNFEQFVELTKSEVNAGLYGDSTSIGTVNGWSTALRNARLEVRGHQLLSESNHNT